MIFASEADLAVPSSGALTIPGPLDLGPFLAPLLALLVLVTPFIIIRLMDEWQQRQDRRKSTQR